MAASPFGPPARLRRERRSGSASACLDQNATLTPKDTSPGAIALSVWALHLIRSTQPRRAASMTSSTRTSLAIEKPELRSSSFHFLFSPFPHFSIRGFYDACPVAHGRRGGVGLRQRIFRRR